MRRAISSPGLTADDFDVFEDGKPQTIQTFSYIELPEPDARSSFAFGGRPVAADVRSNRDVESGRVYIIVLDDLNVAPLRTAIVRRHARDFIEQHFGPRDLAAVVVTSGRKDAAQEFTNDPALLLRAVDNFFGQRLQSAEMERLDNYYQNQLLAGLNDTVQTDNDPQQSTTVLNPITRNQSFDPSNLERGQRAVGVLNTIESLSEFLEGVRGRRKALLWFSEGIDYPMADVFGSQSGNEILQATRNAVNAAARANVNVYALDPRGLIGMTTDFIDSMTCTGAPDYAGHGPDQDGGHAVQRHPGAARRNAAHAGQSAHARGRHRRLCRRRHQLVRRCLQPHHRRQQPLLPARLHAAGASARRHASIASK